jgi:hypothetical protein
MTARFVMKNKPETDENNKYSKASYQFVPQRKRWVFPKYISRACFLDSEASKGCSQIMKNKAI